MQTTATPRSSSALTLWLAGWSQPSRFPLLLGVLVLALYPEVVSGVRTFIFKDFGLFGYPLALYHKESLWRGEIPLWNPLSNSGLPFLAQWNTLVLYPFSVFYLVFPLPWSLCIFNLAHQFLAGWGMYFLARRWTGSSAAAGVASLGFAFNGFTLNCLVWPNHIASLAWMPWVVLAVEEAWKRGGRPIILAGLAGAMQMLSGTPEIILLTWLLLGLLALAEGVRLWREGSRPLRPLAWRFSVIVLLVTVLSAAQLLPFLQLLSHSQRDPSFAPDSWPMPLTGWANLLVPLFRCVRSSAGVFFQPDQNLTSSYYPGAGVLALGVMAVWRIRGRRAGLLAGAVLACLVLALGKHTPIYGWVRKAFPPLGFVRFPVKFVIPVIFLLPLLSALGVARLTEAADTERQRWGRDAMTAAGVFSGLIILVVIFARLRPGVDEVWMTTLWNGAVRVLFLLAMLLIIRALALAPAPTCAAAPSSAQPTGVALLGLALALVVWLDLVTHAPRQNPTVEPSVFSPGLPPLEALRPRPALGESRAMLSLHAFIELRSKILTNLYAGYLCNRLGLHDNCNLVDGIPKVDGFYALYLRHEEEVRHWLFPATNTHRANLADFLGVSQVTANHSVFEFTPRPTFMPMVTAGQGPVFLGRADTLAAMTSSNWDPRAVVFLPPEARTLISVSNQTGATVLGHRVAAQQLEFEVEAGGPSLAVIAQTDYPAWRATIDQRTVPVLRANYAFQAVEVPAGRSRVRLAYQDRWFQLGAGISLLSLVGCGLAWGLAGNQEATQTAEEVHAG